MRSVSIYAGMATAALGGFGYAAAAHADDLNTLSKQCGVATDTLQKFSATSELVDVSTEAMAKGQSKIVKAMTSNADVFDKYGIAVKNSDGSMRDSEDVFLEFMDAMGNITNKTERAAAMQEVFGAKAYQALMPLAGNVKVLQEYGKKFEELGLILDQDTLDGMNKVKDQIDYLKAVGSLAFYKIGTAIANAVGPALDNLDEKIANIAEWISNLNPRIIQVAMAIGGITTIAAPLLIIIGHIATGLGAISTLLSKLRLAALMGSLGKLGPMITTMLGPVGMAIVAIGGLIAILAALQEKGVDVENAIGDFVTGLAEKISAIAAVAPDIIQGFITAIVNNLPTLINSAVSIMNALIHGIVTNLPILIQAGLKLVMALINGLIQAIPVIIVAMPKIIKAIVTGLINMRGQILAAGRQLIIVLLRGIVYMIPRVKTAVINFARKIPTWIKNGISKLASIGGQIVQGLWQGIGNKVAWLKSKISGFVGNVKSWLKKFFKIGSPSKLMADEIGRWIPEGIAVGIEDNMRNLERAMGGIVNMATPDLSVGSSAQSEGINYMMMADVMQRAFKNVTVEANSYLDGKKVSQAIAGDMNNSINTLQARQARRLGVVGV